MQYVQPLEDRRLMSGVVGTGPVLDPRQFGDKYNGHTDDSAAIQAAINALPASGGTVMISGVAAVAGNGISLIGKTNVRVTAAAPGDGFILTGTFSTVWTQNVSSLGKGALVVKNSTNCSIDGLTINGNGEGADLLGFWGDTNTTCANNKLTNVGTTNAAIAGTGNSHDSYTGNTINQTAYGTVGIGLGNGHTGEEEMYPTISNNNISYCGGTGISTMSYGGHHFGKYGSPLWRRWPCACFGWRKQLQQCNSDVQRV